METEKLKTCMDACIASSIVCAQCATECLREAAPEERLRCIELCRECSEAANACARMLAIGGEHADLFCHAVAELCETCADECEKHGAHGDDHCKACAEACRRCAEECRALVRTNA